MVTLTWHARKYKVHKPPEVYPLFFIIKMYEHSCSVSDSGESLKKSVSRMTASRIQKHKRLKVFFLIKKFFYYDKIQYMNFQGEPLF